MIKKLTLHRLTGAIIIFLLSFAAYTLLFRYKHAETVIASVVVPAAPAQMRMSAELKQVVANNKEQPETLFERTPTADNPLKSLSTSWIIKVKTFSVEGEADHLLKQLRSLHLSAYSVVASVGNKYQESIFVGPDLNKNYLKKQLEIINQKFDIQGSITKFKI